MTEPLASPGTIKQYSAQWGISDKTTRRLIAGGEIRAVRIGKRMIRVDLDCAPRSARPLQQYRGDAA